MIFVLVFYKKIMKIVLFVVCLFLLACTQTNSTADLQSKVVGIIPYDGITKEEVTTLAQTIEDFYHLKTVILPKKELPKSAFVNIKSPRYRADSIIRIQNRNVPDSLDFILGLTHKDVSVTKKETDGSVKKPEWKYGDFGVMGLAYCPGKSSIISNFRLKSNNKSLQMERFKKVVIHEFGHNLGLPHCPNTHCVMTSAAEKISTIDTEKMELCEDCFKRLN
jgi:archaemetzincin